MANFFSKILIFSIFLYKILKHPFVPHCCKYSPSCSDYSVECLQKYSILLAIKKSVIRVIRCNPFTTGGFDPS